MPYSLGVYLYRSLQNKLEKKLLEDNNIILECNQISQLISETDPNLSAAIFKSAVVDHKPVNGTRYYLAAPIKPLFYHDYFKRCLIADGLASFTGRLHDKGREQSITILKHLSQRREAGYVQVFAYHALGQFLEQKPELINTPWCEAHLIKAFDGPTASLLGVLVFLESALATQSKEHAIKIIAQGCEQVRYRVQKRLLSHFLQQQFNENEINIYFDNMKEEIFNNTEMYKSDNAYISLGLKEVGFVSTKKDDILTDGTQQAAIALRMCEICDGYLAAVGLSVEMMK